MKILGLTLSDYQEAIDTKLLNYALSLFEGYETEIISIENVEETSFDTDMMSIAPKIDAHLLTTIKRTELLVISLQEDTNSEPMIALVESLSEKNSLEGKGILILQSSFTEQVYSLTDLLSTIDKTRAEVWGSYFLPNIHENFDTEENIIANIHLRLQLIRKVNNIRYNQLGLRDHPSSCGIRRSKGESGDESDY